MDQHVIVVRHGHHSNEVLIPQSVTELESLAVSLRRYTRTGRTLLLSSPRGRTAQTAEIIARVLQLEVHLDERLHRDGIRGMDEVGTDEGAYAAVCMGRGMTTTIAVTHSTGTFGLLKLHTMALGRTWPARFERGFLTMGTAGVISAAKPVITFLPRGSNEAFRDGLKEKH